MSDDLGPGHRWRRPATADAPAIYELVAGRTTSVVGFADVTLDDVRDDLADPDFDPAVDGWLVEGPDGELVGYGWACRNGRGDVVDVDVIAVDARAAAWLWARAVARAGAIGAELGHDQVHVDVGIYRADETQREQAAAAGFAAATTFHRMRIDHDGVPPAPALPDGVVVRTGPGDEAFRREAHAVVTASFAGHFGSVARPFEEWQERIEASATHDWSQLRVAYIDGEPAAMLHGNDAFVADEGCGYVSHVGVLAGARGQGLAKLLLRQAFAEDARRGRRGTLLHVDTNNATPALDLYLGVGMRPVLVVDVWRRTLTR